MNPQHQKVIIVESSVVEATLVIDGTTAHFSFKITLTLQVNQHATSH